MKIFYSSQHIDLGSHVFPTIKYRLVHTRLLESGAAPPEMFVEPDPVSWDRLALVHDARYLKKVRDGGLSVVEIARLELPWSPAIVEGFRLMTGGTVAAARAALQDGMGVNLGGGFHHAFPGHGEGFCLFNDVAVAVRALQADGAITRAAVVDCDVHHGNGTAAIFHGDPEVFTFSMHQEHNYPPVKPPGTLDIGLGDATGDEEYLGRLAEALPQVFASRPQLLCYLAGADPYVDDQLGGLALTLEGLRRRDRLVLAGAREAGVPVAVLLAGGYARDVADTVAVHVGTVQEALAGLC